MSTRSEALAATVEALRTEMLELAALDAPTDEQSTRSTEIVSEYDAAVKRHADSVALDEKAALVREAIDTPAARENGFSGGVNINTRKNADPFENLDGLSRASSSEVLSRFESALENDKDQGTPDSYREAAYKSIARNDQSPAEAARYALLTGSAHYRAAFEKYLKYPTKYQSMLTDAEAEAVRTAMSTTTTAGGFAIPFLLDPTIILTNSGAENPFRDLATVVTGVSNKWQGLTSAGVTAEWKTEGSAAADASPAFTQPAITAFQADAYVFGSYEVLEDTNLGTQLPMLIADAKNRLEADAFAVGSGSGAPKGVVTAVAASATLKIAPQTGGTFTSASIKDPFTLFGAVPPRHRAKSAWVANYATYNIIRQMSPSGVGSQFWAPAFADVPEKLLGRPVYDASQMSASYTTGQSVLLVGDFSQYTIFDRIGMQLDYIPNVFDQASGRPSAQRGWLATWRVGGDATNINGFRVLTL